MDYTRLDVFWPGWRVVGELGSGAFGRVYEAEHREYGQRSRAAIKVIEVPHDPSLLHGLRDMGLDGEGIRAYLSDMARDMAEELKLMQSLKGARNVVYVEDFHLEELDAGMRWVMWVRMELLESLPNLIASSAVSLEPVVVARIGVDVCHALETCHAHGIVHRDVKPANVFRTAFGEYKLGDFGIAKQVGPSVSSAHTQLGTMRYVAPEIVRGESYDERVDVYSLGVMLYELLNGMRPPLLSAVSPVRRRDLEEAGARRLRGEPLPPPRYADGRLASIVLRACEADRALRYPTARSLGDDLRAWLDSRPGQEKPLRGKHLRRQVPVEQLLPNEDSGATARGIPGDTNQSVPPEPQGESDTRGRDKEGLVRRRGSEGAGSEGADNRRRTEVRRGGRKRGKRVAAGLVLSVLAIAAVVAVILTKTGKEPEESSYTLIPSTSEESVPVSETDAFGLVPASTTDTLKGYGTTTANIANGGYVADGGEGIYFLGDPSQSNSSQTRFDRSAIGYVEKGFSSSRVVYQVPEQEDDYTKREISCLHVVDDTILFCERYDHYLENGAYDEKLYDIVSVKTDGTNREVLVEGADVTDCPKLVTDVGSCMWVDGESIFYLDAGSLWFIPLTGGEKSFVLSFDGPCTVREGIAYCVLESGSKLAAMDTKTGSFAVLYEALSEEDEQGILGAELAEVPRVMSVSAEGDHVYATLQVRPGLNYGVDSNYSLSGWLDIDRTTGETKAYRGDITGGTGLSATSMTFVGGTPYVTLGDSGTWHNGNLAIAKIDGENGFATTLLLDERVERDGEIVAGEDGYIRNWLAYADGRLYFESYRSARIISFGEQPSEAETYNRWTPWSIALDGSDLRRGID